MRKFYQTEWHGIPFASFAKVSSNKIADASFYDIFYKELFKKYSNWDELDNDWLSFKKQTAEFIKNLCFLKKESKILSVSCGIGVIEKFLLVEGFSNLEITEVSNLPIQWLRPYISPQKVYFGYFPDCIPNDKKYELIYLSNIEYCFDNEQFVAVLKAVKDHLVSGGKCLILTTAIEPREGSCCFIRNIATILREFTIRLLQQIKKQKKQQLWGYLRNREEFYKTMYAVGFHTIRDGFLKKLTRWGDTYWIQGSKE